MAERLRAERPADYARIAAAIGLDDAEVARLARAPPRRCCCRTTRRSASTRRTTASCPRSPGTSPNTPKDNYPLLLHYHPLVIYRHQVCKQADVVLALLLLSNEFTLDDKRRDFDFYERVTTHDSSLSSCIFSIVASEVGYHDKAYDYFMETARLDLDNTHGNTDYGVHTAAMAGTWLGVAYGFAGMRLIDAGLRFAPTLPDAVERLPLQGAGARRAAGRCDVDAGGTDYRLLRRRAPGVRHRGTADRTRRAARRTSAWRRCMQP